MTPFLSIFTILLFLTGNAVAWERPRDVDIVASSKSGLVKIIVTSLDSHGNPVPDYGSGFVISADGYVISAAHLFPNNINTFTIEGRIAYLNNNDATDRENLIELRLIDKIDGRDTALLKFSRNPEGMRPLPISDKPPNKGDTIYVLGFPGGQDLDTSYPGIYQGNLTDFRFQYQGVANKGNSGGPILDVNGYVVGTVSEEEKFINSTPITNTYKAVPANQLLIPSKFSLDSVRPIYLPRDGFSKEAPAATQPSWSMERVMQTLQGYRLEEKSKYCRIRIPSSWNFRKNPELGFLIAPPTDTALLNAGFQFEFLVRRKEEYVTAQERLASSPRFGPVPYDVMPLSRQSLTLLKAKTGSERDNAGLVAFVFLATPDHYILFRYLPRYFNELQFRPASANSAFLMCRASVQAPRALFFDLCEDLLQQAMESYYDVDNPCLPGTPKP